MKRTVLFVNVALVCLALTVTACGAAEPTIDTPVSEINLTTADLGAGWSVRAEQLKEQLADTLGASDLVDANMRTFEGDKAILVSQLASVKTVASAKVTMAGDFVQAFKNGMEAELPGVTFSDIETPDIGEDPVMLAATIGDLGFKAYVLAFRKANVIATLFVMGPEDIVTADVLTGYGQKLEAKIQ
jgi:hypothetical protein